MTRTNVRTARTKLRSDMGRMECEAFAKYCWVRSLDGTGIKCQNLLADILKGYSQDDFEDRRTEYSGVEFTEVAQGKLGKYSWDVSLVGYLLEHEPDCVFFEKLYGRL